MLSVCGGGEGRRWGEREREETETEMGRDRERERQTALGRKRERKAMWRDGETKDLHSPNAVI